jgi:phosphatidyl-myo-inositol dimannoside synthase
MKTLLVSNDFPPVVSGISTVFYYVWKYLPEEKSTILAPNVKGSLAFDRKNNLQVTRYPYLISNSIFPKLINNLLMFLYILPFVPRVDGIHCGQILSSGVCGLIFKKLFRVPYFLWTYGGETTPVYIKSCWSKFLIKKILDNANIIITISKFTSKEFLDYGIPKEKIIEIIPAVDFEIFKPLPKCSELVEHFKIEKRKTILTISRLAERKGHDVVLKALPLVLKSVPNLSYLIVGDGPYKTHLMELCRELKLNNFVTFVGFVPDKDLVKYYNLCDVFVMPNREIFDSTDSVEGFGITFIEANACSKPVIGGKSGGAIEAVEDGVTGFLVDSQNDEEVAEKIICLLQNEELARKMGEDGRKRVERDFSWEKRAHKLKEQLTQEAFKA